jgi:hypothetical protein
MEYYLIDYENTGENGLKGITELPEDSCVVIFYSENADKISFDMHQKFCICKTRLEFRKINTGRKNALDFQLSTYLGYLIAKSEEDQYYIVSKDNGYRSVVDFWRDKKVRQIDFIARITGKPLMLTTSKDNEAAEEPEEALTEEENLTAETEAAMNAPVEEPETERLSAQEASAGEDIYEEEETVAQENEELPFAEEAVLKTEAAPAKVEAVEDELPFTEDIPKADIPTSEAALLADETPVSDEPPFTVDTPSAETASDEATAVAEDILPIPAAEETPAEEIKKQPGKRSGQSRRKKNSAPAPKKEAENVPAEENQPSEELRASVAEVIDDLEAQDHICRFIVKYKTKQGVNNAIVKIYGTEKAGELYKKIKPLLKDKKGK